MANSTSNNTLDIISLQVLYLILAATTFFLEGYHQAHTQLRVKLKTAEENLQKVVQELKERDQLIEDLLDLQFPEPEDGVEDEEEDENELESWNGYFDDPKAPAESSDNETVYTPQNSEVDNTQGIETDSDSDSSIPTEEIGPFYGNGVSSSSDSDSEDSNYDSDEDGSGPPFRSFADQNNSHGDGDEGYYADDGGYYYYDSHDKDVYEECCCRFSGSFDQIRESVDKISESNESSESVEDWLEVMEVEKPEAVMDEDGLWEADDEECLARQAEEDWEEISREEEGEDADDEAEFSGDEENEEEFTSATEGFEDEEFDEEEFEDEGFEEEESEDAEQRDEEMNTSHEDARELWRGQTGMMEKVKMPLEVVNQNTIAQEERAVRSEESN